MSRGLLLGLALLASAAGASDADRPWLERSAAIRDNPASVLSHEDIARAKAPPVLDAQTQAQLQTIAQDARSTVDEALKAEEAGLLNDPSVPVPAAGARVIVFASQALGAAGLQRLIDEGRGQRDVVLTFRGLEPGQTLGMLQRRLTQLIGLSDDAATLPTVAVDPTPFTAFGITAVPTLLYLDEAGKEVARVRGLSSADWLREQVAAGQRGDLGVYGETVAVSEGDMIEQLQASAAKVKLPRKANAMETYFAGVRTLDLPIAQEDRERRVDPSVEVTEGITAPDGTVIAYAGQRFNPLEAMPFTQVVIAFDARDPRQVARIRPEIQAAGDRRVTLVSIGFDTEAGWQGLGQLGESLGYPVFLLQDDVRERLGIEKVPSVVDAVDARFRVRELGMGAGDAVAEHPGS